MASPTTTPSWAALLSEAEKFRDSSFHLRQLFENSDKRFSEFSIELQGLLLDYSKNYLNDETRTLLVNLAEQCGVPAAIEAMFSGELINNTEQRAALHVALREPADTRTHPEVTETLNKMERFCDDIQTGSWTGYSGKRISDVVNLGIGGSDLGPAMVSEALAAFHQPKLQVHFVSNVDPVHISRTLERLDPETTLFVIASKSFTTLETHQNAEAARRWFLRHARDDSAIVHHFVAITTNQQAASDFGIDANNLFPMWDWVGGRYSLWSAIGLPIALAIGFDNFRQLLAGANAMDQHFRHADLATNMPVMLGLLTVWYTGFFGAHSTALVPYSQSLNLFPSYLQQLYMESLGKRVSKDGADVDTNTGEVVWGTVGTNGQHSYFQLLHQGTEFVPVDFIAVAQAGVTDGEKQHRHLLSNCLSQSLALMSGDINTTDPHKNVPGNKPSNTLLLSRLDPFNLGSLIALYEHKVYVQSVIWDINAFDQWGVELGKALSKGMFQALDEEHAQQGLDNSSSGLISQIKKWDSNQ